MLKLGKQYLVEAAAGQLHSKQSAAAAVDAVLAAISDALADGRAVALTGIGTLAPAQRTPRSGTAPDGSHWETGARMGLRFREAQAIKDRLNPA